MKGEEHIDHNGRVYIVRMSKDLYYQILYDFVSEVKNG